jgi:hypothetical protein
MIKRLWIEVFTRTAQATFAGIMRMELIPLIQKVIMTRIATMIIVKGLSIPRYITMTTRKV